MADNTSVIIIVCPQKEGANHREAEHARRPATPNPNSKRPLATPPFPLEVVAKVDVAMPTPTTPPTPVPTPTPVQLRLSAVRALNN